VEFFDFDFNFTLNSQLSTLNTPHLQNGVLNMDLSAILIKIAGCLLFAFTMRSIYKHVKEKRDKAKSKAPKPQYSKTEYVLHTFLLYAWFAFMTVFSAGMVLNN